MDNWLHQETILTEQQKAAYRYLLYRAMLDSRMLCQSRGPEIWNPLKWRRQYRRSRIAGSLADWLHNLAQYSINDFRGFDADWFWNEYDGLCKKFSQFRPHGFLDYRQHFENELARRNAA